jgi:hypothetical protein
MRWAMIALAFFATLINYLDRQALSVAAPMLRLQFHLSNEGYARILFAFMLAYTIMNGVSGLLIDRLGTRIGYALFVAWWSLSAMLHAFARGALSLGIFRFLLGIGQGQLARRCEGGFGVVPCRGALDCLRHLQQWIIGWRDSCPTYHRLHIAEVWLALDVCCRGLPGLCLAGRVAVVVSRARSHCSRGCLAAESASLAFIAVAVCLDFHSVKGFHGSGVVLLHFLVSRVPAS